MEEPNKHRENIDKNLEETPCRLLNLREREERREGESAGIQVDVTCVFTIHGFQLRTFFFSSIGVIN